MHSKSYPGSVGVASYTDPFYCASVRNMAGAVPCNSPVLQVMWAAKQAIEALAMDKTDAAREADMASGVAACLCEQFR